MLGLRVVRGEPWLVGGWFRVVRGESLMVRAELWGH